MSSRGFEWVQAGCEASESWGGWAGVGGLCVLIVDVSVLVPAVCLCIVCAWDGGGRGSQLDKGVNPFLLLGASALLGRCWVPPTHPEGFVLAPHCWVPVTSVKQSFPFVNQSGGVLRASPGQTHMNTHRHAHTHTGRVTNGHVNTDVHANKVP